MGQIGVRVKTLSAVYLRGIWPQVIAVDSKGRLVQIYGDDKGWHIADTLLRFAGATALAAVDMGDQWPAVMAADATGRLLHITGDGAGWHMADTGVRATAIAAIRLRGDRPYTIRV